METENVFDVNNYSDDDVSHILWCIEEICKSDESEEEGSFATVPAVGSVDIKYAFPTVVKEKISTKHVEDYSTSAKMKSLEKKSLEKRIEYLESFITTNLEQLHEMLCNIDYRLKKVENYFVNKE